MQNKDKDKIIHSENNRHVKRVISQPTKATAELVNSVSGGKGIKSDYKAYQRATQMDHIDNKYRRTYRKEQKRYEESKSNNYQSKTSNSSSGESKTYSNSSRHNESPAERQARSRAAQGRDETRSGNLRTQSEQTKISEPKRQEHTDSYSKTSTSTTNSNDSSAPKSQEYSNRTNKTTDSNYSSSTSSRGYEENRQNQNKKSYSPADRHAENVARQGMNESGGVTLKTQESTGSTINNLSQNTKTSNHNVIANSERLNSEGPQTGTTTSSTANNISSKSPKSIGNTVNDKLTENSNLIKTSSESGLLPIQIQDETGKIMVLNVGESIMLDNGSIIGYAKDENGEGFIFSNFYDKADVSGLGNTITTKGHKNGVRAKGAEALGLNEHGNVGNVAGGMTLKTGVAEIEGVIDVDDFIDSDGARIITVNMGDNKKVNKLGTLISKNDQTKNKKLTLNEKDIKILKTKAKVLFGATVIVRGASFVGNKTIGFFGMMFDGMGSGKSEAEFMAEQFAGIVKGKLKSDLKKATVKTAKPVGKVLAKGVGKLGKYGVKAGAWGLNHFKFGRKVTSTISKLTNKSKIAAKFLAKIGRALKMFTMALKKYLIIAIAFCIFMLGICGVVGGAAGGMSSIFGFLFNEPETLFEKYHNYIQDVDGTIQNINDNYRKGKMPIYGHDLTADNGESLDGYDWATVDKALTQRVDGVVGNERYKRDLSYVAHDPNNYANILHQEPPIKAIAEDPDYIGKINGVNWRAFLSCVQVYNGLADDLEDTNKTDKEKAEKDNKEYDAYDTDNINPYGRFKDEWKSKDSDFIKPKIEVSVKSYYVEDNTNATYDDDPTNDNDEGDKKVEESRTKYQNYWVAKTAVDDYNAKKTDYDTNIADYNNKVKERSNKAGFEDYKAQCAAKNKPVQYDTYKKYKKALNDGSLAWYLYGNDEAKKPMPPEVPADLAQNQSIVSAGEPNKFTHHYKISYNLIDEADYSLNTYSEWFKYAMYDKAGKDENGNPKVYELSNDEVEMLNSLYTSPEIFDSFSELYDEHVTQDMIDKTKQCFDRGILGYDYILACNEQGITIGGIDTGSSIVVDTSTYNEIQNQIYNFAISKLGSPYVWGGTGPNTFDCSGFTQWVFKQVGYNIPRTSSEQASAFPHVPLSELQPGDILWRSGHVGLYLGNGTYIQAPHTGDVVKISKNISSFTCGLRVITTN